MRAAEREIRSQRTRGAVLFRGAVHATVLASMFVVGTTTGCFNGPPEAEPEGESTTAQPVSSDAGVPGSEPVADTDPNCEAFVVGASPISTAWIDTAVQAGACSISPPTVTVTNGVVSDSIFYAACEEIGSSPAECALSSSMQFCQAGYWTKLCQENADCPTGTLCLWPNGTGDVPPEYSPPFGACQKACTTEGSGECGRCDMECDTWLEVCRPKRTSSQ